MVSVTFFGTISPFSPFEWLVRLKAFFPPPFLFFRRKTMRCPMSWWWRARTLPQWARCPPELRWMPLRSSRRRRRNRSELWQQAGGGDDADPHVELYWRGDHWVLQCWRRARTRVWFGFSGSAPPDWTLSNEWRGLLNADPHTIKRTL